MSLGAEAAVVNIPRKDGLHRGSIDTLYSRVIIEFENDLKISLKHAKEQLAGYLLGQFKSGEGYHFTLIASDLITWRVFAPDVSCLDRLDSLREDELVLNEIESAAMILTEDNAEDFYYWIDRFLFREEKQKATLKRIEEAFGYQSSVFIECYRIFTAWFREAQRYGEVQVAFEQWRKFLSVAYGSFDARETIFLIHTYLSVFAKMLAYAFISNDDYMSDEEIGEIIDGSIFQKRNIGNFVDNDFFHWVKGNQSFRNLRKAFRLIAQEISRFDFTDVDEDVLKGVYQELIDLDTRRALGEYYTPDWLCERIVGEFTFAPGDRILDPACGSGSFLRAAIHRMRDINPEMTVEDINDAVYGIDIHPLSVQIAKTTLLLALGKGVIAAKRPIHLNIILANTLLAPEGVEDLFGNEFTLPIDKEKYVLNTQVFEDVRLFDDALEACEELSNWNLHQPKMAKKKFSTILNRRVAAGGVNRQQADSFYEIYLGLKKVKEQGRDSIWKFIIQNLYKPYFLSGKFDVIIGNPPWFTYSAIKNEEYQNILNGLAERYDVKPEKAANFPHLEIAAIFLAHCGAYFLKEKGRLAFVLPRSFFSADHHDNTRSGRALGYRISQMWDLQGVSPLFRVPSCVLFADKAGPKKKRHLPATGVPGVIFNGSLTAHNCNLQTATPRLHETPVNWFYARQGRASAFSTRKSKQTTIENPYKKRFRQGATIVPRAFYFVELDQAPPPDFENRLISIKTALAIQADAKEPWKGITLRGKIESRFLFRTAIARSILPFALHDPSLVVLPVTAERNAQGDKTILLYAPDDLLREGWLNAARWFRDTEQSLDAPCLVLYNASAKDANAVAIRRDDLDRDFFVDHTTYWFATRDPEEAHYLTAILNSAVPNALMKDFQAKGLFGERHVHKKILDVYFPEFDRNNAAHLSLAALGQTAHEKTAAYLVENPPPPFLAALLLGRLRLGIKVRLAEEMNKIDTTVRQIIAGA
ncbi:MAG TPA: restriction endonuclease [Syntrophaceae bacterium]|jgi:type I restriction-modification system DNA methylase subunit|nr:restriction endonuclease [Syntrophaceae bacterium]